jgi:16S rRNA C967 or C1407 C5-methylase (RsmB/RsmF family)
MSLLNTKTNTIEKVNKNEFLEKVYENATDKIEGIILHLEHDKEFREQFHEKYIMHLKNKYDRVCELFIRSNIHKKRYKTNINQLSYNKKELVRNTWNDLKDIKEDDEDMYSEPSDSTLLTPKNEDDDDDSITSNFSERLNLL